MWNWHHTQNNLNNFFRKHKQDCTILAKTGSLSSLVVHDSILTSNLSFLRLRVQTQLKAVSRSIKRGFKPVHAWLGGSYRKGENSFYFSPFSFSLSFSLLLSSPFLFVTFLFLSICYSSLFHFVWTSSQVGCGFRSADIFLYCSFTPHAEQAFKFVHKLFYVSVFVL